MKNLTIAAACGAALLASACTHATDTSGAPSFGQSVDAMIAAQTDHGAVDAAAPEGSGAQGALAQERYRTGATRELLPASSSTANSTTQTPR